VIGDDLSAIDSIIEENLRLRDQPGKPGPGSESNGADAPVDPGQGKAASVGPAGTGVGVPDDSVDKRPVLDFLAGTELDVATSNGDMAELIAERDSYLADSQRLAADFANYRKQTDKRVSDSAAAMAAGLVRNLLPVIDACDSALELDPESGVAPIRAALLSELEKSGLELLAPGPDTIFDPELHEAVMHEAATDETSTGPTVAEVFRAGYLWKGKVVRPAMVKVVGE